MRTINRFLIAFSVCLLIAGIWGFVNSSDYSHRTVYNIAVDSEMKAVATAIASKADTNEAGDMVIHGSLYVNGPLRAGSNATFDGNWTLAGSGYIHDLYMMGNIYGTAVLSCEVASVSTAINLSGAMNYIPDMNIALAATDTINSPGHSYLIVSGKGGTVTLTNEPTIADAAIDGQRLIIRGNNDVATVVLQDKANLAGSALWLGGSNKTLGRGDAIDLIFDAHLDAWLMLSFSDN